MSKLTSTKYIKNMAKRAEVKLNPIYDKMGKRVSHEATEIANALMPHTSPKNPLTPKQAITHILNYTK